MLSLIPTQRFYFDYGLLVVAPQLSSDTGFASDEILIKTAHRAIIAALEVSVLFACVDR